MDEDSYKIPKFDGRNFGLWKKHVNVVLKTKGLSAALVGEPKPFEALDLKAQAIILGALDQSVTQKIISCDTADDVIKFNQITQVIVKVYEMLQDDAFRTGYNREGNRGVNMSETFMQSINKAINLIAKEEGTYQPEVITIDGSSDEDEPVIIGEVPPQYAKKRGQVRRQKDDHGEWVDVCPDIKITKHKRCTHTVKFKFTHKETHIKAWRDMSATAKCLRRLFVWDRYLSRTTACLRRLAVCDG